MRAHVVKFILDNKGEPVGNASIDVLEPGTGTPISQPIYESDTGTATKPNPFYTDSDGKIEFYLEKPQRVEIKATKGLYSVSLVEDAQLPSFESIVYKSSESQIVNNSTTLINDTSLYIDAVTNTTYVIEGLILYKSSSVADFKCTITAPSGSVGGWTTSGINGYQGINQSTGTGSALLAFGTTASFGGAGISSIAAVRLYAVVKTSTTGGTINFRWAQNTAEASDTIVTTGSFLKYVTI